MKIYKYNKENTSDLQKEFIKYFNKGNFVPIIGSGFTKGLSAKRGLVPTAYDLKNKLIELMTKVSGFEQAGEEFKDFKLSQVSEYFWQALKGDLDGKVKDLFDRYMEDHFTNVHDIEYEKKEILNARWRYIYTLNYDDALENCSKFIIIKPFKPQNKSWLNDKRCLYKIHGDVNEYLATGESRFCVLSKKQYLELLMDDSNEDMRDNLEADFASNNIIFMGCSLDDELDIFFAAGTNVSRKKENNSDTHTYYVRYMDNNTKELSLTETMTLEQFSITDVIQVMDSDMSDFYEFIMRASEESKKIMATDKLSQFMSYKFVQLDYNEQEIDYLFYSNLILPNDSKIITLPSFFTRRKVGQEIIDNINKNEYNLHVLRGGRISGRTYVMIDILKEFQARNIYYFPSGTNINMQLFNNIINRENSIIIFDSDTINVEQRDTITHELLHEIKQKNTQIVIAVDKADGVFTEYFSISFPNLSDLIMIYQIDQGLKNKINFNFLEIDNYNKKFGQHGVVNYETKMTFLDFMIYVDENSLKKKYKPTLPNINILNKVNKRMITAMVLFANMDSISISQATSMKIDETLYDLIKLANTAIQKDYLKEVELGYNIHDGFRFIVNSKLWVFQCLSIFSDNKNNYETISNVYYDIVRYYQKKYKVNESVYISKNYYDIIKPYYFFDSIQYSFFAVKKRGSLELPRIIYDKLRPLFKDDYQFLHQNAICLLRSARKSYRDINEKHKYLNQAYQNITRAYQLAKESKSNNIDYTLFHMNVTKVLILINEWRYCKNLIEVYEKKEKYKDLVDSFNIVIDDLKIISYNNKKNLDKEEKNDLKWFSTQIENDEYNSNVDKTLKNKIIKWGIFESH